MQQSLTDTYDVLKYLLSSILQVVGTSLTDTYDVLKFVMPNVYLMQVNV